MGLFISPLVCSQVEARQLPLLRRLVFGGFYPGFIQQTTTGEDGPSPDQIGGQDQHPDLAKARAKEKGATAKSDGAPMEDSPLRLGNQPLVRLAPITANQSVHC